MTQPYKRTSVNLNEFEYRSINPVTQSYEMPTIWELVAGNLASNGYVTAASALAVAKDTTYDFQQSTRVVSILHESGRLAGTFSLTLNSDAGMPVARYFKDEVQKLEQRYRLINGWRFSMSPTFQSSILRARSNALYHQLVRLNDADASVLYFHQRLLGYYRRIFNGHVLATKTVSLDGNTPLPVCMMLCFSADNEPNPQYMHQGLSYEHAIEC